MEEKDQSFMTQLKSFISRHKWAISLVLLGLVICILILTINFWRTLLILVVVGICLVVGSLMDKGGWDMVRAFLDKVLPKK